MLVLSRMRDESILIDDLVEIFVVDIRGDKVRLGIRAPRSMPIYRREVYDRIKRFGASGGLARPPRNGGGMLVLSRQRDESIMIGDDIEVFVVDIRGDKVRLGINAPKAISVHRREVYDAIRRENRAAAKFKPGLPTIAEVA